MYEAGLGVQKDYVMACAWYNIASTNETVGAKKIKSLLIKKMTPEQIAEAEALANELRQKIEANLKAKKN
jgi:TPR repeat protein